MNGKNGKFRDGRSIDFEDDTEIRYWMKYLDTSKDELLAAVSAVGDSAQRVKEYLETKREALGGSL